MQLVEGLERTLQPVRQQVGHCDQLHRAVGRLEGVNRRAAAADATADQRQSDGVVLRRVNVRRSDADHGLHGGCGCGRGGFQEFAARWCARLTGRGAGFGFHSPSRWYADRTTDSNQFFLAILPLGGDRRKTRPQVKVASPSGICRQRGAQTPLRPPARARVFDT